MKLSPYPKKASGSDNRAALLRNLDATTRELTLAYQGFDESCDADLTDFYLHEIDALRARHTYLLRRITALESPAPTNPAPTQT